jgi:hypothetical protein
VRPQAPLPRHSPTPRPMYRPPVPPAPRPLTQAMPQLIPQLPPQALPSTAPAAQATNDPNLLATMLALLANPNLQQSLQAAVGSNSIPIGNTDIPVSAAIDIIGQLAGALSGTETPPAQEHYPDFLFDSFGNALVNPDSVEDTANLLLQRLQ